MTENTVPQLVSGGFTERYMVRRKIDQAIAHLEAVVDRLIDSQLSRLEYHPDYSKRVVEIIRSLMPVRGALRDLRASTYVWDSFRAVLDVSDPAVQHVMQNERRIAMEHMGLFGGVENTDVKED